MVAARPSQGCLGEVGRAGHRGSVCRNPCQGGALSLAAKCVALHRHFPFSSQIPAASGRFLTGAWLQQPLSACFPKGVPGLSVSRSARLDPRARWESWPPGLPRRDMSACSWQQHSERCISTNKCGFRFFFSPVSAACGLSLPVTI